MSELFADDLRFQFALIDQIRMLEITAAANTCVRTRRLNAMFTCDEDVDCVCPKITLVNLCNLSYDFFAG
jgi:hypothetical protein